MCYANCLIRLTACLHAVYLNMSMTTLVISLSILRIFVLALSFNYNAKVDIFGYIPNFKVDIFVWRLILQQMWL